MGYGKITKEEAARRENLARVGLKVCSKCKRELPYSCFSVERGKKDGHRSICRECASEMERQRKPKYQAWCAEHKEQRREYAKNYYQTHKEERTAYNQNRKGHFRIMRKKNDHRVENRFKLYASNAYRRGIEFALTLPEFDTITQTPCRYCGELPNDGLGSSYTGIDRIDSSKGYFSDNVVPCCEWCNKMKLDHPVDEWLSKMKQICEHMNI